MTVHLTIEDARHLLSILVERDDDRSLNENHTAIVSKSSPAERELALRLARAIDEAN